jgi:lysophospholipase L1-like esterase
LVSLLSFPDAVKRIGIRTFLFLFVFFLHAGDAGPGPDLPENPAATPVHLNPTLPSIFIASDSTAARSSNPSIQGWAEPFKNYFDPTKVNVVNLARGGRSSRTFISEGLWAELLSQVKTNDLVLIQFGHNDATAVDSPQARGSLPGVGMETQVVTNAVTKQLETVHTFGWYIRQMIADTKAKGATPILVSLTLHNTWHGDRLERGPGDFAKWLAEIATSDGVPFVDLSALEADAFQAMGQAKMSKLYRGKTHFGPEAANLHAQFVVIGLRKLPHDPVGKYLSPAGEKLTVPQSSFEINSAHCFRFFAVTPLKNL